jgi:hypothetical protein
VDRTNAERQRRYIERLKARAKDAAATVSNAALEKELAQAKARNAELERELTSERERRQAAEAAPRDNKDDRIAELEAEIRGLRLHIRFGPKRRPAEPKAEKPPLPPDEERDRIIKGLKTRVRNLTAELHHEWEHAEKVQSQTGAMDFRTTSAIAKCLFPDQRHNATEADKDKACRAFTAWKADSDKARRKAR